MTAPLMPKATAVWLVENTTLTFRQIAFFCELHELEVQAIADGDIAYNIVGMNPITTGQLTWEEIRRCEANSRELLQASELERNVKARNAKFKKVLSPSQRADKPSAILWILKNYPEIIESQICKLIGTTKSTIEKIKKGEYKDASLLRPKNPVAVGLCTEKDMENALKISKSYNEPKEKKKKAPKKTVKKISKTVKKAVKKEKKVKATAKKVERKTAKKSAAKKTTVKKEKAVTAKKVEKKAVKKAVKKEVEKSAKKVKKSTVKKTVAKAKTEKKAVEKKEPKKATAKKAVVKKPATKKVAKKTAPKKPEAKKTAVKKAVKKVAAKKVTK